MRPLWSTYITHYFLGSQSRAEPSLEQIEAEFWRIVESPEEQVESLYGQVRLSVHAVLASVSSNDLYMANCACAVAQSPRMSNRPATNPLAQWLSLPLAQDVDSGHHGSGFPLPLWRRRLLEQFLMHQVAAAGGTGTVELPAYANGGFLGKLLGGLPGLAI